MSENLMNSSHKASNQKSRDGWERTFGDPEKIDQDRLKAWMDHSKVRCNGCKEIREYFKEHHNSRSCKCSDCGKVLLNPEHKTPEEG